MPEKSSDASRPREARAKNAAELADLDYDALDPGIRMTVRLLRSAGFETTDSGDGVSKPEAQFAAGEALPFPHVVVKAEPMTMAASAEVVQWLLGPKWTVEASYSTLDHSAILFCRPRD